MRTSVAFASLLLLLATTVHGIRLDRQLKETINKKKMVYPTSGTASVALEVNKRCSPGNEHCSSSGTTTKNPLTHSEESSGAVKKQSSTGRGDTTITGNADAATPQRGSEYQQAAAAATTPRVPWQRETATYPDIMDIAGMDYSPATRRSPIHN